MVLSYAFLYGFPLGLPATGFSSSVPDYLFPQGRGGVVSCDAKFVAAFAVTVPSGIF